MSKTSTPIILGAWCSHGYRLCDFEDDEVCADHWADAGLNMAMAPSVNLDQKTEVTRMWDILDRAAKRDLKLMLLANGCWSGELNSLGEAAYRKNVARVVEIFGNHPALFGFYVGDEPTQESLSTVCLAMRIHNEMAPHLNNFLNHRPIGVPSNPASSAWDSLLDAWIRNGKPKVLSYDCYEQFNTQRDSKNQKDLYFQNLLYYQQAAERHGLPYWNSALSTAFSIYRPMTEDDFRWQLNTTLAHGAKGIMYFFFYQYTSFENYRMTPVYFGERTEYFTYLRRVHDQFVHHTERWVRDLTFKRVQHYGTAYGGAPEFDGSGLVMKVWADVPLIISEFNHANGDDYVMVVNNSRRTISMGKIWFRVGPNTVISELRRINNRTIEENVLTMHYECWNAERGILDGEPFISVSPNAFAPGQMYLYRLTAPLIPGH